MKRSILIALLLAMTVLVWGSCTSSDSGTSKNKTTTHQAQATATPAGESSLPAEASGLMPKTTTGGTTIPAVAGQSALDLDGGLRQLSEWIGRKPVVLNIWGTWCPPCRREIPGLIRLYDEYQDRGVEIVSLAVERRAGPAQVRQFTQQAGMKWVQLMANERVLQGFGYSGSVPTTIFFDKNGQEVSRHIGARPYDVFKHNFEAIASGS